MKVFFFSLFLSFIFGAICPNKCNSNGKCLKTGKCECNDGFEGYDCRYRECPSGSLFPGGTLRVCSGNGDCNRETGVCNCYEGFEGDNCANIGCVNECSGHGVCVSSASATYVLDNNYPYYKSGANNQAATPNIYVCVCDNEYTGYDCSEKKCPLGYMATGACDAPQELQMTLEIPEMKGTTDSAHTTYIEYTDQFDNKWYSKKITLKKGSDSVISKYGDDDMTGNDYSKYPDNKIIDWSYIANPTPTPPKPSSLEQFKWCYVFVDFLYTLPPGTIDLKNTTLDNDDNGNNKIKKGCYIDSKDQGIYIKEDKPFTVTLNFGKLQTGNKSGIRFITKGDVVDTTSIDTKNLIDVGNSVIVSTSDAVSPLICSGFGNCDKNTGKCKCYDNYKGYVCNEQI